MKSIKQKTNKQTTEKIMKFNIARGGRAAQSHALSFVRVGGEGRYREIMKNHCGDL